MLEITLENMQAYICASQRFLTQELINCGARVYLLNYEQQFLLAKRGDQQELFVQINSRLMPSIYMEMTADKAGCKWLLQSKGLSVAVGECFKCSALEEILQYSQKLQFPLVLKPNYGTQGHFVYADLQSTDDLIEALMQIKSKHDSDFPILIEQKFIGNEYRVFLMPDRKYAAVFREPAFVIGDGHSSIRDLAEAESERRLNPRSNCLCPISLDHIVDMYLRARGLSIYSVPELGQKIRLRDNSNLYSGGWASDVTQQVHASIIDYLMGVFEVFPGLPYVGIDFMTKDISQPLTENIIVELNTIPAIGPHHGPAEGTPVNVCKWLVELLFK